MLLQAIIARDILVRIASDSEVFVDIGAHIGSVTAEVLRLATKHIIAVEAIPKKAEALQKKFPRVRVYNCALGASSGPVKFYVDQRQSGYSSLNKSKGMQEIEIEMRTLDELVDRADVLKIDVEGAELLVLQGAQKTLEACRPLIMFESVGPMQQGGVTEGIFAWFAEREYLLTIPNRLAHDGPTLDRQGFLEAHAYPFRTHDYFAVPSERRNEFRDRARRVLRIEP